MKKALLLVLALIVATSASADERWTSYINGRFGYSLEYPDIFTETKEPDNGDGVWLKSNDEEYELTISGGYNVLGDDGASRLASRLEDVAHIVPDSDKSGGNWYRVIYSDDGGQDGNEHLFHEYGVIDDENWASFILVYPKDEEQRFTSAAVRMEKSLTLPKQ